MALPGVLPPFNEAGQVHVDGGVIDNLPVRAMRRHRAAALTIAIDIDTGGALAAGAGVEEPWSAWEFFRRLIWKRERDPADPLDRAHPAALGAGRERRARDRGSRQAADLLIVPPMTKFDLLDWTSFDAAIEVGYRDHHEGARQGQGHAGGSASVPRLTGPWWAALISPNG